MSQIFPFLEFFSALTENSALAAAVSRWKVKKAVIHKEARTLEAQVLCPSLPSDEDRQAVEAALRELYSMTGVTLEMEECEEPGEERPSVLESSEDEDLPIADAAPGSSDGAPVYIGEEPLAEYVEGLAYEDAASEAAFRETERMRQEVLRQMAPRQPKEKRGAVRTGKVIFGGREIKKKGVPMSTLTLDMGSVVVEGDVFAVNHRELKKRKAWVVSFDVTDYTGSIRVSKFFVEDDGKPLVDGVRVGDHLRIQGKLNLDRFTGDMVLEPHTVQREEKLKRTDTAGEKRVELHLHTSMSAMDALTPAEKLVKRAREWGHRAIAITDHGSAQAFPEAWHASKDIKILYGVEAYMDDHVALHGVSDQPLEGEIVCFDIETTGLSCDDDAIIEIGAVVLRDGEVGEQFSTFVDPGRPLSQETTDLTGITADMLVGAPSQEEAVNAFLEWAAGRPLAAHNADFDTGFFDVACRRMGKKLENPWLDSLAMARAILLDAGLKNFKLDTVADYLRLPSFQHHRAFDDAATVGYMLIPFFQKLRERGVRTLGEIDRELALMRAETKKGRSMPRHVIILAKNQQGLRNLYRLVSDSFLKFYKRYPIIPKSEIERYREGLIIGTACEAGELFQAIVRGRPRSEQRRIAAWYDFLEIQPLCNNGFMLRPDKKTGRPMVDSEETLMEFNRTILALGKELDKPVCATGDVHFLDPEEEIYRHILLDSKGFEDCDESLPIYFKTTNEMLDEFSYLGSEDCYKVVIRDPNLIADMCERMDPLPQGLFAPKLKDSDKELEKLVYDKAHELYGDELPKIVQDRIDLELPGIIKRKYDVIYMSAQKLVQNSLEHGYLVGSRGSVGSSIVAFLSGITEVNALPAHYRCPKCRHSDFEYGPANGFGCGVDMPDAVCPVCGTPYMKDGFDIPFETFLGFGGDKVPDIDLNFSGEYQAKAHRYTFELFGDSHVFRAGTIGTVAEKTAYGYVKKYLEKRGLHATSAEENRLALGCTGVKRTTGQHPGGMVVIPQDREIYDFCPVQHPADDPESDIVTTHFEYHSMESNLLKLDMLGHDDPTMIRMLEDLTGVNARTDIKLDDPETMSLFISSEALGYVDDPVLGRTGAVAIPEFNTKFTRQMLMDTDPTDFNTLVRLSGFSHGTDVWLGNARELIVNGVASVLETVGCRDDIMLYLIKVGVEPKTAFKIMEAVRKGKVRKNGFENGWEDAMRTHGVPDWYIQSLGKISYLFPKAHAVAYVMMGFRIAWFKVHRPLAFYAAFFSIRAKAFDATIMCRGMELVKAKMKELSAKMNDKKATNVEEDTYTTLEVVYEFYLRGFTFRQLDLYRSDAVRFLMDGEDALIPPFIGIPGLGESAAQDIVEQREGRQFISVEELADACTKVSKTHIEQLKAAGVFDDMPETSQITLF